MALKLQFETSRENKREECYLNRGKVGKIGMVVRNKDFIGRNQGCGGGGGFLWLSEERLRKRQNAAQQTTLPSHASACSTNYPSTAGAAAGSGNGTSLEVCPSAGLRDEGRGEARRRPVGPKGSLRFGQWTLWGTTGLLACTGYCGGARSGLQSEHAYRKSFTRYLKAINNII